MILEVKGLRKKYKKSDFAIDMTFSVPSGAIMGLVGENGSGKTTTIGCILNTLIKDSGSVKIFGQEMADHRSDIRDDIGVVFDTNHFPGELTPLQISSAMNHIYSRWDGARFLENLEKYKLPHKRS